MHPVRLGDGRGECSVCAQSAGGSSSTEPTVRGILLWKPLLLLAVVLTLTCTTAPLTVAGPAPRPALPPGTAITALTAAPPRLDSTPVRLVIPRISVDTAIEARGLDQQRNLATPSNSREVAWFNQGPPPGQAGNAIINGHVNWWTGSAVFARLGELRVGDAVMVIRQDGTRVSFTVSGSRNLAATARDASLFAPASTATLTLITCSGPWDLRLGSDTERLLVSASLV